MGDIYSNARQVTVWLGEEDRTTCEAFNVIQKMAVIPANANFHNPQDCVTTDDSLRKFGIDAGLVRCQEVTLQTLPSSTPHGEALQPCNLRECLQHAFRL